MQKQTTPKSNWNAKSIIMSFNFTMTPITNTK